MYDLHTHYSSSREAKQYGVRYKMSENWHSQPVQNIRNLPWFDPEYFDQLLVLLGSVIHLPNLDIVLEQARQVFESSRSIDTDNWQDTKDFIYKPNVRKYLQSLFIAYKELHRSASHSVYYCAWPDKNKNVCGSLMDIRVEQIGAFYVCQTDKSHRTQYI